MSWAEVKKINSDLDIPINHLLWAQDFKTYGTNSYVYVNSKIFLELMHDYKICANDMSLCHWSFYHCENVWHDIGKYLDAIEGSITYSNAGFNGYTFAQLLSDTTKRRLLFDNTGVMGKFVHSFNQNSLPNRKAFLNGVTGVSTYNTEDVRGTTSGDGNVRYSKTISVPSIITTIYRIRQDSGTMRLRGGYSYDYNGAYSHEESWINTNSGSVNPPSVTDEIYMMANNIVLTGTRYYWSGPFADVYLNAIQ